MKILDNFGRIAQYSKIKLKGFYEKIITLDFVGIR
jgi:hypothetical protein